MSRHATLCHVMSRYFTSCRPVTSLPVTSFLIMSRHASSRHVMSRHVTLCHVMSCHATSCHIMSRHATSCHVMPRHVTSCHIQGHRVKIRAPGQSSHGPSHIEQLRAQYIYFHKLTMLTVGPAGPWRAPKSRRAPGHLPPAPPSRRAWPHHVTSCYVMSRYVLPCHVLSLPLVTSRYVTSCHVMPRCVTSCYVTSCHVMSRPVTSCHVGCSGGCRYHTASAVYYLVGLCNCGTMLVFP